MEKDRLSGGRDEGEQVIRSRRARAGGTVVDVVGGLLLSLGSRAYDSGDGGGGGCDVL